MKQTASHHISKYFNLLAGSVLVFAMTAAIPAAADSILCWRASDYDLDGDGYADYFAHKNARVELDETEYTFAEALTCPAGWVKLRGDVDDSNPAVHPRRQEVAFNNIDDDGDGRIDEPTMYYGVAGFSNTKTAFTMQVRIHDNLTVSYYNSPYWDLLARVEYQKLQDTTVTMTSTKLVSDLWSYASYSRTDVRLTGLQAGTVYRARIHFVARYKTDHSYQRPVGESTTWFYTMTDSDNTKMKARKRILLRALYEQYLSERGATGYLGTHWVDGTRYGATPGEWWCSEFYSWVTDHELDGMGSRSNTALMIEYFEQYSAWAPIPEDQFYLIGFANAGDYLGIVNNRGEFVHSAMFMEYEPGRDIVWSVEGNATGRSDIDDGYASRRGSNEAVVVQRASSTVGGWGMITSGMLR